MSERREVFLEEKRMVADYGQQFREDQEARSRERQLVALGMAIASTKVRTRLSERDFADAALGAAFGDLIGGGGKSKPSMKDMAQRLGLPDWDPGDSFTDLLLEHVRLDARLQLVFGTMARTFVAAERTMMGGVPEKIAALEKAERLIDEAQQMVAESRAAGRVTAPREGGATTGDTGGTK